MEDASSAACSVSEHLKNEEEPPPPKKAKLDRPGDAQPKKLLGLGEQVTTSKHFDAHS